MCKTVNRLIEYRWLQLTRGYFFRIAFLNLQFVYLCVSIFVCMMPLPHRLSSKYTLCLLRTLQLQPLRGQSVRFHGCLAEYGKYSVCSRHISPHCVMRSDWWKCVRLNMGCRKKRQNAVIGLSGGKDEAKLIPFGFLILWTCRIIKPGPPQASHAHVSCLLLPKHNHIYW